MSDTIKPTNSTISNPMQEPLRIFDEFYSKTKQQFESLKVDDFFWHTVMEARQNLRVALQQLQMIPPSEQVKIHDKVSNLYLWLHKLG